MHVEAFVLFKPDLHRRMFVRDVVVHDKMQLKMFMRFSIDFLKKSLPLLMPMLALDAADQAPLKIVQRSEQSDGAVADIIVRLSSDKADPKWQSRLGALKSLHLTFFIAAEHQCLVWQINI